MPLNVLPSITKPPVAGSRAPRWMLDSLPVRRPDPHSTASTTRSRVCTGLTLSQPAPRRPASYGAVGDFAITPSWPAASVASRKPLRGSAIGGDQPVDPLVGGHDRVERGEALGGRARSSRSTPSRCSRSKKNTDSGCAARCASRSPRAAVPNRDAVTWNRCGRPSGRSAMASPSAIRSVTGSARVASTTSGSRVGDVVEAAGVDRHRVAARGGSGPGRRRAWPRKWRSPPSLSSASATPVAVCASIGPTGRPTCSVNCASAPAPPVSAAAATAGRSPPSIAARRTSAAGTPAALATASAITPTSAPWRSSPPSRRRRNVCSIVGRRGEQRRPAVRRGAPAIPCPRPRRSR